MIYNEFNSVFDVFMDFNFKMFLIIAAHSFSSFCTVMFMVLKGFIAAPVACMVHDYCFIALLCHKPN